MLTSSNGQLLKLDIHSFYLLKQIISLNGVKKINVDN